MLFNKKKTKETKPAKKGDTRAEKQRQLRENRISIIMENTGWRRDRVVEELDAAKEMGISSKVYTSCRGYEWSQKELEALSKEIEYTRMIASAMDEKHLEKIEKALGIEREAAEEKLALYKSTRATKGQFMNNKAYLMNEEELEQFKEHIKERKAIKKQINALPFEEITEELKAQYLDSNQDYAKKRIKKAAESYLELKNPEDMKKLYEDLDFCNFYYGMPYKYYFLYSFINKTHEQRDEFLNNEQMWRFVRMLNGVRAYLMGRNNYLACINMKEFFKREVVVAGGGDNRSRLLKFAEEHPVFVYKPYTGGSAGDKIRIIRTEDYKDADEMAEDVIKDYYYYLEEYIEADERMAALNPSSLNTVKVITYKDEESNISIYKSLLSVGRAGGKVDSFSVNGLLAGVDPVSGKVITTAKNEENEVYAIHPDTGKELTGFEIPCWKELKDTVIKAAESIKDARFVCWEMALSQDKGWLVVDVNCSPEPYLIQVCDETGKKSEMKALIDWENLGKKKLKSRGCWEKLGLA